MRSKNSKALTEYEREYIALVKQCCCVVCGAPGPSDAHHVEQELHFLVCSLCKDCHQGPHGWHGDKSRWRAAKMTEMKAINLTRHRVEQLRAGVTTFGTTRRAPKPVKSSTYQRSPKICARRGFI